MIDENGIEMTEQDILQAAIELMGEVLCLLYETESPQGNAAGFMADSLTKYLQVIIRGDDVLSASADYTAYEEEVYRKRQEEIKKNKEKMKQ